MWHIDNTGVSVQSCTQIISEVVAHREQIGHVDNAVYKKLRLTRANREAVEFIRMGACRSHVRKEHRDMIIDILELHWEQGEERLFMQYLGECEEKMESEVYREVFIEYIKKAIEK